MLIAYFMLELVAAFLVLRKTALYLWRIWRSGHERLTNMCVTVEVIVYNPHIVKLLMSHDDKTAIYLLHVNKIRCEDNLQAILQKHYWIWT